MASIPLGLIGCGTMGRRHLRGLRALADVGLLDFQLVAVTDPDTVAANTAADEAESLLGVRPRVLASADEVLADDSIIAVDLVTPPATHHRLAVQALEAGRHLLCEKPLSITLRGCRSILSAVDAAPFGTVLAVQEQFRRGPANRMARAVVESGLLGEIFVMNTVAAGGSDRILLSAWRHLREHGSVALDNGVHLTDVQQYILGTPFESVSGRGLIAEPVRRRTALDTTTEGFAEAAYAEAQVRGPASVQATGEDSIIALYQMENGVSSYLVWLPSGPGHRYFERTVHGRAGSMALPADRSGGEISVRLDGRTLGFADLRQELPDYEPDEATVKLFPNDVYEHETFEHIDGAHIGMSIWDFGRAIIEGRPPEVGGRVATDAVAAIVGAITSGELGRSVTRSELLDATVPEVQRDIDAALGLI